MPIDIRPATDRAALLQSLRSQGFTRIAAAGRVVRVDEPDAARSLPAQGWVDVILDRLVRGKDAIARRIDSIESAFAKGLGRCRMVAHGASWTYTRGWRCSHCGTDHIEPQPNLFRFNAALGACPVCEGVGQTTELDLTRIVPDASKSIRGGAIAPWATPANRKHLEQLLADASALAIPVNTPFAQLAPTEVQRLVEGVPGTSFSGLNGFFRGLERKAFKRHVRLFLGRWRRFRSCPACQGARLRPEALAVRIGGRNIAELAAMTIRESLNFLGELRALHDQPVARRLLTEVEGRLAYLDEIGLNYLTLDRSARSLSGGEIQRVVLTKALGSATSLTRSTCSTSPHSVCIRRRRAG